MMKSALSLPLLALILYAVFFNPMFLGQHSPITTWVSLLASPQIYFFAASVIICWSQHLSPRVIGLHFHQWHRHSLEGIGLGIIPVALALLLAGVIWLLTFVGQSVPLLPPPSLSQRTLPNISGAGLINLLLLAPITEEVFFRGVLLNALRKHYSHMWAIAISALIFMWSHSMVAVGPLVLGLLTAWLTIKRGSLVPGIVFHVIANTYAIAIFWIWPELMAYVQHLY